MVNGGLHGGADLPLEAPGAQLLCGSGLLLDGCPVREYWIILGTLRQVGVYRCAVAGGVSRARASRLPNGREASRFTLPAPALVQTAILRGDEGGFDDVALGDHVVALLHGAVHDAASGEDGGEPQDQREECEAQDRHGHRQEIVANRPVKSPFCAACAEMLRPTAGRAQCSWSMGGGFNLLATRLGACGPHEGFTIDPILPKTPGAKMHTQLQRQLSIALENQPGRLAGISRLLADRGIHIEAVCLIDNVEQGMVRLTTSDAAAGRAALESAGLHVVEAEVLAIETKDRLGKLAAISEALAAAGINIEYAYASVDHAGARTRLILKTTRPREALRILDALRAL